MTTFFESLSPTQPLDQVGAVLRSIVESFGDGPQRLQLLREIVVETSRFSFSPLADSPLSGSAREAAFPSATASQKPNQVRKQRKPRPVKDATNKQAQFST